MNNLKRLLSLLVSLAIVFTCLSGLTLTGFAADTAYVNLTFSESDYTVGTLLKQGTEPQTLVVGDITYGVGGRSDGGGDAGFYVKEEGSNVYLQAAAGKWASASRNAYLVIDTVPESLSDSYLLSLDVRFTSENSKFILKDSSAAKIAEYYANDFGAELNTWYTFSYAIADGSYCAMLTDKESNIIYIDNGETSLSVIRRIDFMDENNQSTIDFDNLSAYSSTDSLIVPFSILAYDSSTYDPIIGAAVTLSSSSAQGAEYLTDQDGSVNLELISGLYNFNIIADGYMPYESIFDTLDEYAEAPMDVIEDNSPASITLSESQTIYKPASGTSVSEPFTATVYNSYDMVLDNEPILWSIEGNPDGASIADGIVTLTPDFAVEDDSGVDLTITATSQTTPSVSAQVVLHVNNTARLASFELSGNSVIKNGYSETYSIISAKDQYGADYAIPEDISAEFTADNSGVTFSGATATANISDLTDVVPVEITAAVGDVTASINVVVHGYDFYEPGTGYTSQDVRVEDVDGTPTIAWPTSSSGTRFQYLMFPEPITFTPGTTKEVTWEQMWNGQGISAQYRLLLFLNGSYSNERTRYLELDYLGGSIISMGHSGVNKVGSAYELANAFGPSMPAAGTWEKVSVIFKTLSDGATKAIITYQDLEPVTVDVDPSLTQLDRICMYSFNGIPDNRNQFIKNVIIKDAETTGVSISGPSYVTKREGTTVTAQYTADVTIGDEGETFTWTLSGDDLTGISIDSSTGLLSVAENASAGTVDLTVTSDLDSTKTDTLTITINDFASVADFTINGPLAVSTNSSYNYSVSDITDEYGDKINTDAQFSIASGDASISPEGILTTTASTGVVEIEVTVGTGDRALTKTLSVVVDNFYYINENLGGQTSVTVNTSDLFGSNLTNTYKVSLLKGSVVYESETTAQDGVITVNTTGASKVEISPLYRFSFTGNNEGGYTPLTDAFSAEVGAGFESAATSGADGVNIGSNTFSVIVPDGLYDVTVKKGSSDRVDLFINGDMIGQNVDQDGWGRTSDGALYTAEEVSVSGGMATLSANDLRVSQSGLVESFEISKNADFKQRSTHFFIAGDSTVAVYYETNDAVDSQSEVKSLRTGWSQVIENYLGGGVFVKLAESGSYTSKWYADTFPSVLNQAESGDYLFIQFGFNDAANSRVPLEDFKDYLRSMIDESREKGVIPIIMNTMVNTNKWGYSNDGTPYDRPTGGGNAGYYAAAMEVAEEKGTLSINLQSLTADYLEVKGNAWTDQNYQTWESATKTDSTHMCYQGASLNAMVIAQAIYDAKTAGTTDSEGFGYDAFDVKTGYAYSFVDSEGETITFRVNAPSDSLIVSQPQISGTTVSVNVQNPAESALGATLYVAAYDANGSLIGVNADVKTFETSASGTLTASIPDGYVTYKIFVWDSADSMKPLI